METELSKRAGSKLATGVEATVKKPQSMRVIGRDWQDHGHGRPIFRN